MLCIYINVCVRAHMPSQSFPCISVRNMASSLHLNASGDQMYDQGSQVCGRGWCTSASKQCQVLAEVLTISTFNAIKRLVTLLQDYYGLSLVEIYRNVKGINGTHHDNRDTTEE